MSRFALTGPEVQIGSRPCASLSPTIKVGMEWHDPQEGMPRHPMGPYIVTKIDQSGRVVAYIYGRRRERDRDLRTVYEWPE